MTYNVEVELCKAREIIAGFLLWHDPAYKPGRYETLEGMLAEARDFLWPEDDKVDRSAELRTALHGDSCLCPECFKSDDPESDAVELKGLMT